MGVIDTASKRKMISSKVKLYHPSLGATNLNWDIR